MGHQNCNLVTATYNRVLMHYIIHYEPWTKASKILNLSQASIARKIRIKWMDFVYISLFLLFLAETQMF
jgi:hypothetical protein